jgi:hypothetical protein
VKPEANPSDCFARLPIAYPTASCGKELGI